jgi:hypothetical protein
MELPRTGQAWRLSRDERMETRRRMFGSEPLAASAAAGRCCVDRLRTPGVGRTCREVL